MRYREENVLMQSPRFSQVLLQVEKRCNVSRHPLTRGDAARNPPSTRGLPPSTLDKKNIISLQNDKSNKIIHSPMLSILLNK